MSDLIDTKNINGEPINKVENKFESKYAYIDGNLKKTTTLLKNSLLKKISRLNELSDSEIQQNISNISNILEDKDHIDFIGVNDPYSILLSAVALDKKVGINYIDPTIDPAMVESSMYSNTLVISELLNDKVDLISSNISDRKNVIIGTLYKEELTSSRLHR